ncbi:RNA helicase [Mycena venus]|uniref:ATP-dependent RNA helicase n=1 Tax=Mycena venus TaxID=2733690 RepID=A0A8H6YNQ0_9AGAR|nr:RNA helicase [Mycena venus]
MDDLVLNLTTDHHVVSKHSSGGKGGRWTDRLKAKRVEKRKARTNEKSSNKPSDDSESRPAKRPRIESSPQKSKSAPTTRPTRPQTQVISSLFSYNPKIEAPVNAPTPKVNSRPSNAPLADSSGFSGLGLDPLIAAHLVNKMNIDKPTSIQRAVLPAVFSTASQEATARDVFIQSQTGSGKTLSFLLPIIQDLLPLSSLSYIDRSIGTLAIIIAPTRELAKQISDVLEALLQMRLRPGDEPADDPGGSSARLTRWLVSGLLTGGATRTHEKARIRKGLPIIVSTPGRLLDHLQSTSSFNVAKCRWLVLDEADRLMELGFEETITGIIQGLDGRRKLALQAVEAGKSMEVGGWDWDRRRRTILCSATIREDVQKLAGKALINPMMIKATAAEPSTEQNTASTNNLPSTTSATEKFTPPSQLAQKYVVVPLKLRLVALVALLRSLIAQSQARRGTKIIVFLSCTDSVDFHFNLLGGSSMGGEDEPAAADADSDADSDGDEPEAQPLSEKVEAKSSLLPDTSIFRLHGSLPTPTRLASLRGFSGASSKGKGPAPSTSSVLLCTSVASRGLDLPLVRAVVQYDLPTEGGATEYVHRVGRTARAGKGGEAWSMVSPSESEWVKWVEGKMRGDETADDEGRNITLAGVSIDNVLRSGFGGKGSEYEARATEVQLAFERWVLRKKENAGIARKAYLSHMRAYATHPSNEKHIFHVRHLHLGHLAKSFALRDAPKTVSTAGGGGGGKAPPRKEKERERKPKKATGAEGADAASATKKRAREWEVDHSGEAERRMQEVVRSQGRLTKKGGVMMSSGASEFQIAGGAALERGGGIGGLCLAVALSKYAHIQVDVYEGAGRFREIGAGVMIWARTWRILDLLGLAEHFAKVTDTPPRPDIGFEYRRSDRSTSDAFKWNFVAMPYGCIRFHRAHFLDVFVDNLPEGIAHFGKRLVSYEKQASGEIYLAFADGTNAVCDLLVGCDGIKSVVRAQMLRAKAAEESQPELLELIEPKWTGTYAYRGLIPSTNLPSVDGVRHRTLATPMMYCGQDKHIVAYSISQGNVVNFVAFASELDKENQDYGGEWVTDCTKEEVLTCFAGWESEALTLLERVDKPTKWGIHHIRELPFYVAGRIVLLGDAAHGMSPHLGSGAGQAIEDAYVLANVLGAAPTNSLDKALEAYERTRLPVANHVLRSSFESGKMYEFNSRFAEEYNTLGPAIGRQWGFLTESTPEGEAEKAVGILRSLEEQG